MQHRSDKSHTIQYTSSLQQYDGMFPSPPSLFPAATTAELTPRVVYSSMTACFRLSHLFSRRIIIPLPINCSDGRFLAYVKKQ